MTTPTRRRALRAAALPATPLLLLLMLPSVVSAAGDSTLSVTTSGVVVNAYAMVDRDITAGSTSVRVADINDLDSPASGIFTTTDLAAGDLVLIVQMQGASYTSTNTLSFGEVTALNGAGNYELAEVASISGRTITLSSGVVNAYDSDDRVQVVRVPRYESVSVSAAGSITGEPWDGEVGGLIVMSVSGDLTLNGTIDADGLGFAGGVMRTTPAAPARLPPTPTTSTTAPPTAPRRAKASAAAATTTTATTGSTVAAPSPTAAAAATPTTPAAAAAPTATTATPGPAKA